MEVFFSALVSIEMWLRQKHLYFLYSSGFVVFVFRVELALFLGPMLLIELYHQRFRVAQVIMYGVPIAICCLCKHGPNIADNYSTTHG